MNVRVWVLVVGAVGFSAVLWWWGMREVGADPPIETIPAAVAPAAAIPVAKIEPATAAAPVEAPAKKIPAPVPAAEAKPLGLDDYKEWQRDLVDGLILIDQPDTLLAAALVLHALYANDPADAQKLRRVLHRAQQLAPGDRTIAATAMRICSKLNECDASRYVGAVRSIDASNALGKIDEVLAVVEKGDAAKSIDALRSIQGLRLELYNSDALARTARALLGVPTSPRFSPSTPELAKLRSELALRSIKAVALPAYSTMIPFCRVNDWRRRQICDLTVRELSRAESMELQRTGIAITRGGERDDKYRHAVADDADAYLSWVTGSVANTSPPAEQWIEVLAQRRTELDASLAWLELQGVPKRPAPSWFRYR